MDKLSKPTPTKIDFEHIFDVSSDLIFIIDQEQNIIRANQSFIKRIGIPSKSLVGSKCFWCMHQKDKVPHFCLHKLMLKDGQEHSAEMFFEQLEGWFDITLTPLKDKEGNICGSIHVFRDITKRKLAEAELRFQGEILNHMAESVHIVQLDGVIAYSNSQFNKLFGYKKDELLGKHVSIINAPTENSPEETATKIMSMLTEKGFWGGEVKNIKKDGTFFWSYAKVIQFDHAKFGKVFIAVQRDITELKIAEKKLKTALEEKEVLLQEVHHRVKNNLQTVMALIQIRRPQIHDDVSLKIMDQLNEQIRTISVIYTELFMSERLSQISMQLYFDNLTLHLFKSFNNVDHVKLEVECNDISLNPEWAMPCGLAINELVTNALKYAFPQDFKEKAVIGIKLWQEGDTYILQVSDNGVGIPDSVDSQNPSTTGLNLVNEWATKQMEGTIDINKTSGTVFTISFLTVDP